MAASHPAHGPLSGESRLVLLWMVVVFAIVLIPFLLFAIRRATITTGQARRSARSASKRATVDAWSEAGRRLTAEPGHSRLDDTVDIDPFDSEDEPW